MYIVSQEQVEEYKAHKTNWINHIDNRHIAQEKEEKKEKKKHLLVYIISSKRIFSE